MSQTTITAPAIMDTVLGHLTLLFLTGAGGDLTNARHAAAQMLAIYNVETPDELRLAAEIISFGFHALEALSQAATPDMALTKVLRLRGSAVSLSREGHKAQRKLDQLQRERRASLPTQAPEKPAIPANIASAQPQLNDAVAPLEFMRDAMGSAAATHGGKSWTKALQQREITRRITANLKKNQDDHIASRQPAIAADGVLSTG